MMKRFPLLCLVIWCVGGAAFAGIVLLVMHLLGATINLQWGCLSMLLGASIFGSYYRKVVRKGDDKTAKVSK